MAGESSERKPRVVLIALGCRVSRAERDALAANLVPRFVVVDQGEPADYVVVNTCAITGDADSASRQTIRRAAREHPEAQIIAAGCSAELAPQPFAVLPSVVAVVGARSSAAIPDLLKRLEDGEDAAVAWKGALQQAPAWLPGFSRLSGRTRPALKIQDGCNARCSYCVVPVARGPSRSMKLEEALSRLEILGKGHAEVVLSGVHLGVYGRDLAVPCSLADLIRRAAEGQLVRRLRISSVEPLEFPLTVLAEPECRGILCEHFHIPLQSGSQRLLDAMRRPYRIHQYAKVVEQIATRIPGAGIGTDVMVGFPGESDDDHQETVRLVESLPFSYLHVFPWSPRPGTDATRMPGKVPGAVVRERAQELRALSDERWRKYLAAQVGRTAEVIVERVTGEWARGTARHYLTVCWPAVDERRGSLVSVQVQTSNEIECVGIRASAL